MLLLALQVGALINPPGAPGTVFLAVPDGRTKPTVDLDKAGFSIGPKEVVVGDVQRVNISAFRWIGGPKPKPTPRHVYITMASTRLRWNGAILVGTRAEDGANSFNDPRHGTADWRDVRQGCLDRESVDEWGAGALFGPPNTDGVRCLIGWKDSR